MLICVPQSGMVSLFLFGLENLAEKTRFYRFVMQMHFKCALEILLTGPRFLLHSQNIRIPDEQDRFAKPMFQPQRLKLFLTYPL